LPSHPDEICLWCAGKPLPPLFNWSPGELNALSPEQQQTLQPRNDSSRAPAP
jgi:hypothetical protein